MTKAKVAIILFTYNRLAYAKRTIAAVHSNLRVSGDVWLHIADDGSSQAYRDELFKFAHEHFGDKVSITNSERRGYGASYNLATQAVHEAAEFILPLEDDWELSRELNLDPLLNALKDPRISCIRLGYVGWTQALRGEFIASAGKTYLLLDPSSPEPHVFAGHPRIETVKRQRLIGPWPEGLRAGETEFAVAHWPEARAGIVWPVDLVLAYGDLFLHIGSVKAEETKVGENV